MIQIDDVVRRLGANAAAIRSMLETIPPAQAQWKPDAETWSLLEVMEHIYNEERIDFRQHLQEIFSEPQKPWGRFDPAAYVALTDLAQGLQAFLTERETSLAYVRSLEGADWERTITARFGPEDEPFVLRAGDVLLSWVEHDILHMRQLVEMLHAWNEHDAPPYELQYAGGW